MNRLQRHKTGDIDLETIQTNVATAVEPLLQAPISIANAVRVDGIAFPAASTVVVTHKLGRTPVGWLLVDAFGAAAVAYPVRTAWDSSSVTFASTNAFTGSVVFW